METCNRCGRPSEELYSITVIDCFGEEVKLKVCWDCDFDIVNGADPFADILDILEDRKEEA